MPSSSDTSSMSDVTDILCAVSKGDLAGAASSVDVSVVSTSPLVSAAPSLVWIGTSGTSGAESGLGLCTVVSVDSRLLRSDRDRDCERSVCDSGRGVISDASSKLSCIGAHLLDCVREVHFFAFDEAAGTHCVLVRAVRACWPLGLLVLLHVDRAARGQMSRFGNLQSMQLGQTLEWFTEERLRCRKVGAKPLQCSSRAFGGFVEVNGPAKLN